MPISHEHKLIFIHVPKNAGTSLTNALKMVDGGHHTHEYYKHKYPNIFDNYVKISVIRNPWDRIVSNYEYAKMEKSYWHSFDKSTIWGPHPDYEILKNISFEECVNKLVKDRSIFKHHGWGPQNEYIVHNNKIIVDQILEISQLNEYIKNNFSIELPFINKSNNKNYKQYYNQDLIDKVGEIYFDDIRIFNFKF